MIKNEHISSRLMELIEDYVGKIDYANIENTSLYYDLGIYGDDADELLAKYSERFNVSVDNFLFSEFFPNEGINFLFELLPFVAERKEYKKGDSLWAIAQKLNVSVDEIAKSNGVKEVNSRQNTTIAVGKAARGQI